MHHPIDKIAHTTAFVIPFVEYWLHPEVALWVHYEESILIIVVVIIIIIIIIVVVVVVVVVI